jgi:hypothetical protein
MEAASAELLHVGALFSQLHASKQLATLRRIKGVRERC